MGKESKCSSAGFSALGLLQAAIKVLDKAASHLSAPLGRTLSQEHGCWQNSVYYGLLVEDLSSLLIISPRPPLVLYHTGLSKRQLKILQFASPEGVNLKRQRKRERKEVTVFHYLVSEVVFRHFCHMLGVRRESLSPAHTQGEGIAQGRDY